jgi:hypothetical protein
MTTKIKSGVIGDNVVGITQLNVSDGTNGQVLITDGAGTLSFSTISGYTDSDVETYLNTSEVYTDATNDRLGIGTNSPSQKLQVEDGNIYIRGVTEGEGLLIQDSTASTGTYSITREGSGSTGYLKFGTPTDETHSFVFDGGNVGIAAIPSGEAAAAHVVRLGDKVCISEYDDGSNPEQFNLFHNSDSSETYIETGYATNIQQRNGEITFKTAASGTAGAAITFSDKVKILNNGNVGIGVSPSSEFHVKGDANTVARIEPNNNSGKATLLVSSSGSGDGGMQYDANLNKMHIFSYSDMSFNVGTGNLSGGYPANERMKIDSNGVILGEAGTATPPNYPGTFTSYRISGGSINQPTWGFNAHSGGSTIDYGYKASGSGDYAFGVLNYNESTWMSRLGFDGRIYLTNTTIGSISDRRLKENIVDANSQWNDIKALQFKNYTWKNTERGTGTYLGLIADEVKLVSPSLVEVEYATKETLPENGIDPEYEGVKYSIVWMKAVKALQEAMTKIETLETIIDDLNSRIETLEG